MPLFIWPYLRNVCQEIIVMIIKHHTCTHEKFRLYTPTHKPSSVFLSLVPTCPENRKNRGFLRFSDVWDSYDQCEHPIPEGRRFYDVIGRIRSISTLKVHPRRSPTIEDFYDECEHEICLSETSGMLDFVFNCYQSLIFSELSIINV